MSNCYGYEINGKVCKCGRHHGCGAWSPEQRAALYKRMEERMPTIMNDNQRGYLADWEKHHGFVRYRMDVVGKHTTGAHKGQDIMGAVFIDPDEVRTADMFEEKRERADTHG